MKTRVWFKGTWGDPQQEVEIVDIDPPGYNERAQQVLVRFVGHDYSNCRPGDGVRVNRASLSLTTTWF